MSFFEESSKPKKQDADPRVRASGWGNSQRLGTHGDISYAQKARQAQSSSSSIVGGKIVKPIHAEPRSNLPSNVHGFHNGSTPSETSWTGSFTDDTDRMRHPPVGATNRPAIGATNFAKNAPNGLKTQPGPSKVGQMPASKTKENVLPHQLGFGSTASGPTSISTPTTASNQKATKHGTRAAPSMNSGTAAKSAKWSSRFPCHYNDCTQGFEKERDLKIHKYENHDYCRVCDEDFDDDEGLLLHKIESEYHICCRVCGQDFRSEGGRDRHERQFHSKKQSCKCVGCGHEFDKGSALIDHIYENKCRDRNDRVPKLVNEQTIRKQRALAALHMDNMCFRPSDTSRLIKGIQPSEDGTDTDSIGGVSLDSKHLLDSNEPMEGGSSAALSEIGDDASTDLIDLSDDGTMTPTKPKNNDFPSLAEAALVKGKSKQQSVIDGLDALSVNSSKQGTGATMVDWRQAIVSGENGEKHIVRTDWDHMIFKRNALDGHYHCPFNQCPTTSLNVDDMKQHLTSGFHQGTDHRCLKCLRHFKTPVALIAHMESNSERCRVKETDTFGQMLSVVSGGFLGVGGRHSDGSIKIVALNKEELEDQESEQRALLPYEDVAFNWSL